MSERISGGKQNIDFPGGRTLSDQILDDQLKQIELMKNIFVEKKELQEILDKHGERTGNTIYSQLVPELQGIQKELERGHDKFEKQDENIEGIKIQCASNHPKRNGVFNTGTDLDKEEQVIHKRAKVYVAIAVSVFAVVVVLIGGTFLILNTMGVL
jgi:uncharacterized protein with von Willebrand factor type A (vWA) domain